MPHLIRTQFMKIARYYKIYLFLALILMTACDSTGPVDNEFEALNNELTNLLIENSQGKGLSFFTMPESVDYSKIPQDPKNPIIKEKVELGKQLFHETCISVKPKNSKTAMHSSCASCHHFQGGFQANLPQGIGVGGIGFGHRGEGRTIDPTIPIEEIDIQPIRSPSAMNVAWQKNVLWNGQFGATGLNIGTEYAWTTGTPKEFNKLGFEGIETQAIAGQSVHLMKIDESLIMSHGPYIELFRKAFPNEPEETRINPINTGMAIAAYERTIMANQAPFQMWLKGNKFAMNKDQLKGAIIFFGKAKCVECHTGPALNSENFYAKGLNDLEGPGVYGTVKGRPETKGRGGFTGRAEDMYKFKVPQLYNLKDSPFLGHGASIRSIRDFVKYMNEAKPENSEVPEEQLYKDFIHLGLTEKEIDYITAFIEYALYDANLKRYVPAVLLSGFCFPNNDPQSQKDLGCK